MVASLFAFLLTVQGIVDQRQPQQMIFMLAAIAIFSFVLRNIWITAFLLWTVFLFAFFKFNLGSIYLTNIFLGCVIYFCTKVGFKKKNINLFINAFLWFVFANIVLMCLQLVGFDFIFSRISHTEGFQVFSEQTNPRGFMGNAALVGILMALAIPLLATRNKWWIALVLFVPLYISKTSLCFLMGIVGLLFVLFFRIPRKMWIGIVLILALSGAGYIKYVDSPGTERLIIWKQVLRDAMIHPITGWGLDSFSNITPQKDFRYSNQVIKYPFHQTPDGIIHTNITFIQWWGNPHNIVLSLFFEFGVIGLILFGGYIRQGVVRFMGSIKDSNTIGLAGFMIVLLGVSMGHFPLWLARCAIFVIPMVAMYEISME